MTLLFAGGGTGGHLFPGLAVARAVRERYPETEIVFVGTRRGLEERVLEGEFTFIPIDAAGMVGRAPWKKIAGLYPLAKGMFQSRSIVKRLTPRLVFSLGGYSAGPVGVAAWMKGIPLVLQEQNMVPGATNRLLSGIAKTIFVSFEGSERYFPREKIRLSGNPVRPELLAARPEKRDDIFSVLVLGGSQGSRFINTAVPSALADMNDLRPALRVVHQTGKNDFEETVKRYREQRVDAEVMAFIDDMGEAYAAADLIVARAGATTMAEITALGKAAIFIPFPHATHNHQEKNARFLEEKGACMVLLEKDTDRRVLSDTVRYCFNHPEELALMRKRSRSLGRPNAAGEIAEALGGYLT